MKDIVRVINLPLVVTIPANSPFIGLVKDINEEHLDVMLINSVLNTNHIDDALEVITARGGDVRHPDDAIRIAVKR